MSFFIRTRLYSSPNPLHVYALTINKNKTKKQNKNKQKQKQTKKNKKNKKQKTPLGVLSSYTHIPISSRHDLSSADKQITLAHAQIP